MQSILIATFSYRQNGARTPLNGMIEPLLSYFGRKSEYVDLIDGVHPGSGTVDTFFELYKHNRLVIQKKSYISRILQPLLQTGSNDPKQTNIWFKLRDILSVPEWLIRSGFRYDMFIGLESIYTIAGIFGKKMGRIKTVIYYVSDYSPTRYHNRYMNSLYLRLDRFCCYHADYIWDVSPAMMPARSAAGLDIGKAKPVIHVSNGLFPSQLRHISVSKIKKNSLVYAGSLGLENGPELAIDTVPLLLPRYPKITLHFYGGPPIREKELLQIVTQKKLQKHVFFHGLVTDINKLSEEIQYYAIGLAPYKDVPGSLRKYADATKIRLYLGCGVPVVTTNVPPLGQEVSKKNAAVVTEDTAASYAKGIAMLLGNRNTYTRMKAAAVTFSRTNTWEHIYDQTMKQMNL